MFDLVDEIIRLRTMEKDYIELKDQSRYQARLLKKCYEEIDAYRKEFTDRGIKLEDVWKKYGL